MRIHSLSKRFPKASLWRGLGQSPNLAEGSEKKHFEFLDGLRGLAAFAVALLHTSQIFFRHSKLGHAYLAVDFFFCLSGFVVAYAYDDRLRRAMTVLDFSTRRLIRLYPMILVGIALGLAASLDREGIGMAGRTWLLATASLLLLPAGLLFHQQAYPINNPLWSLFFELAANFFYAVQTRWVRLSGLRTLFCLGLSAAFLAAIIHSAGSVEFVGFVSGRSFLEGFVRVVFSFLAGIVIFRYGLFSRLPRLPALVVVAALLLALLAPVLERSWFFDAAVIVLIFPVIVAFGAEVSVVGAARGVCSMCGRLSYPFYVIHQPIIWIAYETIRGTRLAATLPLLFPAIGLLIASALSYALLILYDQPVRQLLSRWYREARAGAVR